jgi:hypothetical protein
MREDLLAIMREIFARDAFAERLAYSPDEAAEPLGISRELVHDLLAHPRSRPACAWRTQGQSRWTGLMEAMSKSNSRRFPVTVTHLPVTRCQICRRTVAYRPGSLSEVLTEHYRRVHPEALGLPSR